MLDELAKRESEVKSVEQLFTKIRNDFGETSEEERKIEQLEQLSKERGPAMSMCRNSKRLPEGAAIRKDPLLKNSRKG